MANVNFQMVFNTVNVMLAMVVHRVHHRKSAKTWNSSLNQQISLVIMVALGIKTFNNAIVPLVLKVISSQYIGIKYILGNTCIYLLE